MQVQPSTQTSFYVHFVFFRLILSKKEFHERFPIKRNDEEFSVAFELRQSRYLFVSASLNFIREQVLHKIPVIHLYAIAFLNKPIIPSVF